MSTPSHTRVRGMGAAGALVILGMMGAPGSVAAAAAPTSGSPDEGEAHPQASREIPADGPGVVDAQSAVLRALLSAWREAWGDVQRSPAFTPSISISRARS